MKLRPRPSTLALLLAFAFGFAPSLAPTALAAAPFIIVDQASPEIFPAEWRVPPISASAVPLPAAQQAQCREILERELPKYPAAVLKANLEGVYVISRLEYRGVTTGGTNSRRKVYLVMNERFSDLRFAEYLHAEFSSILLRNHPEHLDATAWKKNNPEGFTYLGSGVQAIRENKASVRSQDALYPEGFLQQYGKASLEEDFNGFAGRLLMGEAGLWEAMEKHPRIKAKAELVIAFFTRLDPALNDAFFRNLPRVKIK